MRYWETSALIPFLVEEASSSQVRELYRTDSKIITWWGTSVECVSAFSRLEREGKLTGASLQQTIERLYELQSFWNEVEPSDEVRKVAIRLLRVHALRSQDSLQLAAALTVSKKESSSTAFVCLDQRLNVAAQKEGFKLAIE